ncbi:hypothetical protein EK21DRAFT_106421 [Setomelanomma holmii]|uniref:Uncharacterized protein n=1 Tax=Setomelanomma holmii TaxID=210430 RepID=A0A9P4HL90_9PLEO|nr:hypothetical protein EK21DRAFT_106421 [Setomelanomma holmii]
MSDHPDPFTSIRMLPPEFQDFQYENMCENKQTGYHVSNDFALAWLRSHSSPLGPQVFNDFWKGRQDHWNTIGAGTWNTFKKNCLIPVRYEPLRSMILEMADSNQTPKAIAKVLNVRYKNLGITYGETTMKNKIEQWRRDGPANDRRTVTTNPNTASDLSSQTVQGASNDDTATWPAGSERPVMSAIGSAQTQSDIVDNLIHYTVDATGPVMDGLGAIEDFNGGHPASTTTPRPSDSTMRRFSLEPDGLNNSMFGVVGASDRELLASRTGYELSSGTDHRNESESGNSNNDLRLASSQPEAAIGTHRSQPAVAALEPPHDDVQYSQQGPESFNISLQPSPAASIPCSCITCSVGDPCAKVATLEKENIGLRKQIDDIREAWNGLCRSVKGKFSRPGSPSPSRSSKRSRTGDVMLPNNSTITSASSDSFNKPRRNLNSSVTSIDEGADSRRFESLQMPWSKLNSSATSIDNAAGSMSFMADPLPLPNKNANDNRNIGALFDL